MKKTMHGMNRLIAICMMLTMLFGIIGAPPVSADTGDKSISQFNAGDLIYVGGRSWIVLNPQTGYVMQTTDAGSGQGFRIKYDRRCSVDINGDGILTYMPLDDMFQSRYNEAYNYSLSHDWGFGNENNENGLMYTSKAGFLSKSEFIQYQSIIAPKLGMSYFWTRTTYSRDGNQNWFANACPPTVTMPYGVVTVPSLNWNTQICYYKIYLTTYLSPQCLFRNNTLVGRGSMVVANPTTGGSITAEPTVAFPGTPINLNIQAEKGMRLKPGSVVCQTVSVSSLPVINNSFSMPSQNVTVSAIFEKDPVTVTYNSVTAASAGTPIVVGTDTPLRNFTTTAPALTLAGFDLTGWTEKVSGAVWDFTKPVSADMDLVAQWTPVYSPPPSTPTIESAIVGNGQATVSFTTEAAIGSSPITGYTVTANPGNLTKTGTTSPITISGLTNGTAYTFTVTATNAAGASATSAASGSVMPVKASQTLTFSNPGTQTFGMTPQLIATSDSKLPVSFSTSTPSICSITPDGQLTFLSAGTATINADQAGDASYSPASTVTQSFTVNAVAPGAPTIETITGGSTQATVNFTPPTSNGGSTITGYTVTSNPGNLTETGTTSPITVTGLTNGTAYTFTVTSTNIAGSSADSLPSATVTPVKASQTLTFSNPGAQSFGTTPKLVATSDSKLPVSFSTSTPLICSITPDGLVTFLKIGTATINTDQPGDAYYSAATTVTQSFAVNAVTPSAPTIGAVKSGNTQATVNFAVPSSNGGSPITGYTVTSNPGNITKTGTTSPITITGLTNDTAYTFTVTATNSAGSSTASAASNSVTPVKTSQALTFSNPGAQKFGTTPKIVATSDSKLPVSFSTSTPSICSITPDGQLTFLSAGTATISANQAGDATYSAATTVTQSFTVNAVTPSAPKIGAVTSGHAQATVNFSVPSSNGGSTITGYTVSSSPGNITKTGTSSPITITGLTNGTAYTFTVTATNSTGSSTASAASSSVTPVKAPQTLTFSNPGAQKFGTKPKLIATSDSKLPVSFSTSTPSICSITPDGQLTFLRAGTATISANQSGDAYYSAATTATQSFTVNAVTPSAPKIGAVTNGHAQATVNFSVPSSNGGSTITGYTVTSNPGNITKTGPSSPITVTGLTNGTAYTFTVTSTNTAGTSTASAISSSVTPVKAPQTLTFSNPGAQKFGTTPKLIATSDSKLPVSFSTSTPSICSITPDGQLTFLRAGTATISANQAGDAYYSAATTATQSFTVNAVTPSAPKIGAVTSGNAQATVNFAVPASNGGSPITEYTATSSPGNITKTGTTSPIILTGLTNGTAYTFTVTATNAAGRSVASVASSSVTPVKASQTLTFLNPGAQKFGTTPKLIATSDSKLPVSFSTSTPSICSITPDGLVTFLKIGTATIGANQAGNAYYSAATTATQSFTVNAVTPSALTIESVTSGNAQATVNFAGPSSNGGSPITEYTVTSSPGNITKTGTTSPITLTGLTNGTAYTFTVTATNAAGTSVASAVSVAVTPAVPVSISSGGSSGSYTPSTTPTSPTITTPTNIPVVVPTPTVPAGTLTIKDPATPLSGVVKLKEKTPNEALAELTKLGIFTTDKNTKLKDPSAISQLDFVVSLAKALHLKPSKSKSFKGLSKNNKNYELVAALVENGLLPKNTVLRANTTISQAELDTFMAKAYKFLNVTKPKADKKAKVKASKIVKKADAALALYNLMKAKK